MENSMLSMLDELYIYSKSVIDTGDISTNTLIILMNKLVQIVEKYKILTGQQKKMLILDTLSKIVNENIDNDQEKVDLLFFITSILPKIIDTIVSAINGDMKFSKDIKQGCLSSLFKCFTTSSANTHNNMHNTRTNTIRNNFNDRASVDVKNITTAI